MLTSFSPQQFSVLICESDAYHLITRSYDIISRPPSQPTVRNASVVLKQNHNYFLQRFWNWISHAVAISFLCS